MSQGSVCCRFSCTHLSVTVVTSLSVFTKAFTSLPLRYISTVGYHPVSPTMFISPVAWFLAMGTTGMKSTVLCLSSEWKVLFCLGHSPGWCCVVGPAVVVHTVTLKVAWLPAPMTDWLHSWWGLCWGGLLLQCSLRLLHLCYQCWYLCSQLPQLLTDWWCDHLCLHLCLSASNEVLQCMPLG